MNPFPCRYCGQRVETQADVSRHMRRQCYTTSVKPAPAPPSPELQQQVEDAERTRLANQSWPARWRRALRRWLWLSNEHSHIYQLVDGLRLDFEKLAETFNLWQHSDAVHVNDVERDVQAMRARLEFYERHVPALRRAKGDFDAQQPPPIAPDGVFVPPVEKATDVSAPRSEPRRRRASGTP